MTIQRIYAVGIAAFLLVMPLVFGGCSGKDEVQAGPTLESVELSTSFSQASSTDTDPTLDSDTGDASYDITVSVSFEPGSDTNDDTQFFDAQTVTTTLTVGGTATPVTLTNSEDEDTFSNDTPVSIPISAKGQTMTVHVQGVDSRGLHSNTVDFTVTLD